ncbi:hypothetical protein DN069_29995 [Streptacidiphilus pinicola]|uniref:Uncharacterized protein n=1 Tax=Streptacidiphilus pinicola TaxID=2219663 RepID=A0A2X0JY77_9ACTN|nr:hypothetical protein [Streptacidiphilus pinicola]RAG81955.1 hypothetical protein DN069_29995 [Streptacidiphilus pinicola]
MNFVDASITYGENGIRCGCGSPAHSNLSPCDGPDLLPRRGDYLEGWLKQQRDACSGHTATYNAVDGLLDDYRLHAGTGTPLDQHCGEGGSLDNYAGGYDAKGAAR